ncbi:MAG: translation initiation factor IF-2 [Candidatus Pacebacteria bacterium]|nr:translation initiation factor IF-2 [Candidatus Paceibacterota bacterium]
MAKPTPTTQNVTNRPPVVVIMGHIDHGKSTLLDYIRKSNIVAGEAGGITQHVGAYQVEHITAEGKKSMLTFLDTPGHAAFCSIRERGAQAADVAILVVSAEDGVKPQTMEAYKNIKDQNIPFIVAINKIDKPNANVNKTKESLGEKEIYVEGWGGDIPCVEISALKGTGVSDLLDMIMLVTEISDLKSNPSDPAGGVIIETERSARSGISATLLIKNGTLTTGTFVVSGDAFAPVRFINNFKGEKIESGIAGMPVMILGWSKIPACGLPFVTISNKKEAEKISEEYVRTEKIKSQAAKAEEVPVVTIPTDGTLEVVTIPVIIKTDVIGSLEGIKHELIKITHDRVKLKIVSEGLGEINENDVKIAIGDPHIIIIGFNADPDKKAAAMIERAATPINVKNFKIIYELIQYVQDIFTSKIPKEYIEEMLGRAKILAVFSKEKDRQVIGGKVQEGVLASGAEVRIIRRENEIGRGKIRELQSQKKRVDEVAIGFECGMMVESKMEIAVGDKIEAVRTIEKI